MSRLVWVGLLILLFMAAVSTTDISGKWSGSIEFKGADGQTQTYPLQAEFQQHETALTGTIGSDQQFPVEKGIVEGKNVRFEVTTAEGAGQRLYSVTLSATSATQLDGTAAFEQDGQKRTAKVTLTRSQ